MFWPTSVGQPAPSTGFREVSLESNRVNCAPAVNVSLPVTKKHKGTRKTVNLKDHSKIKTNKKETRNKWLEIISLPQEKDMYIYDPK